MSEVIRQEEYELHRTVYATRNDAGVQAMRAWLYNRRDRLNTEWVGAVGEQLTRLQGSALEIARLIKLIDTAPIIRGE